MKQKRWIVIPVLLLVLAAIGIHSLRAEKIVETAFVTPFTHTAVLDAGHGGEDGGATSLSGILESGINLEIAKKTDALLRFYGVKTVLVRDSDMSIHDAEAKTIAQKKRSDLNNRVRLVNAIPNAVLISIHQNTYPEQKYFGAQFFYGKHAESQPFATLLQENMLALDSTNTRKVKPNPETVFLMNRATCPAVLAECGFLTNPNDERKLTTANYQIKIAAIFTASFIEWENGLPRV